VSPKKATQTAPLQRPDRSGRSTNEAVIGHLNLAHASGKRFRVAVFASGESNMSPSYRDLRRHATKCWATIENAAKDSPVDAIESAKRLVAAGCDWVYLLAVVEVYCLTPSPELTSETQRRNKQLRMLSRKIAGFASRLSKLRKQIEDLNRDIGASTGIDAAPHAPDFTEYDGVLAMAQSLTLPSAQVSKAEKGALTFLYHLVKSATGRPHYRELADLVQARSGKVLPVDTLQIFIKRFKKEQPKLYRSLATEASVIVRTSPFWGRLSLPSEKSGTKS
jgi:hypothetical protein